MDLLENLFPAENFTLVAVILGLPLLGAFVNGVFGKRLGKEGVRLMALAAICGSFLACGATFFALRASGREELDWNAWHWLAVSTPRGGLAPVDVQLMVDPLNAVMILIIT